MIELIGWIGSVMLAVCGLPQLIQTLRTKDVSSLSGGFIGLWLGGEVALLIYLFGQPKMDWVLLFNYGFNTLVLFVLAYYKCKE